MRVIQTQVIAPLACTTPNSACQPQRFQPFIIWILWFVGFRSPHRLELSNVVHSPLLLATSMRLLTRDVAETMLKCKVYQDVTESRQQQYVSHASEALVASICLF